MILMWRTEEQATKYFKSKNRNINKENIKAPTILTVVNVSLINKNLKENVRPNFIIPNVPSFNTKLAKIMEQVPEALPWALGSQK